MNTKHHITTDITILLLRLVAGGMMIAGHGYGKLLKLIAGPPYEFADPLGIGVHLSFYLATFAEFLCSVLLILGLFTRLATIPLIITMSVVAFIVHINDGLYAMELPLMYLTMYIVILIMGPGRYALSTLKK